MFDSDNKNGRQVSLPEEVYLALYDAHYSTTCIVGDIKSENHGPPSPLLVSNACLHQVIKL
jgi:hypothetical protein